MQGGSGRSNPNVACGQDQIQGRRTRAPYLLQHSINRLVGWRGCMHPESEGAVPGLRAGAAGCAADSAWQDAEAGTARHADVSGAGNWPQAGQPPPPLLGLHPSAGEAAAHATHAAALLDEPHWHGRIGRPQDNATSGSRAGAGLSRTPSYPSTDLSTLTATTSPGGGWLAGFKRALRKLKREVKALNYAVQVMLPPRACEGSCRCKCSFQLGRRDTGPGAGQPAAQRSFLHTLPLLRHAATCASLRRTRAWASCPACWRCSPSPTC